MSKKVQVIFVQKSVPVKIWVSFLKVHMLRRVEEEPRINVRRSATAEGLNVSLV
jgi:hypothetical protein